MITILLVEKMLGKYHMGNRGLYQLKSTQPLGHIFSQGILDRNLKKKIHFRLIEFITEKEIKRFPSNILFSLSETKYKGKLIWQGIDLIHTHSHRG